MRKQKRRYNTRRKQLYLWGYFMPKRTTPFQRLIKNIYSQLAEDNVQVKESVLVGEKYADSEREIDILIKKNISGRYINIAVECRERKRKDSIQWIDEIIGKYINLEIDEIIAVSKSGFSKPAKDKAKHNRIKTLMLEKAMEVDWNERLWGLYVGTVERNDFPKKILLNTVPKLDIPPSLKTEVFFDTQRIGTIEEIGKLCYESSLEKINQEIKKIAMEEGADFHSKKPLVTIPCTPSQELYFYVNEKKIRVLGFSMQIECVFSELREINSENHSLDGIKIKTASVEDGDANYQVIITQKENEEFTAKIYPVEVVAKKVGKSKRK